jgi:PAS domain-containing protein
MQLYALGLELTILLTFWVCLGTWQRSGNARSFRATPGQRTFVTLGGAAMLWCVGELAHQHGAIPEIWSDRLLYLGILSVAPLWAGFAAHSVGLDVARRAPWLPALLLIPNLLLYGLLYSERWSGLFLVTVPGALDRYGSMWWVALVYSYALVVTGSAIFLTAAIRGTTPGLRVRRASLGLAALAPLAGNALYVADGLQARYDPTPLLFGVALFALRHALLNDVLFRPPPITQHDLIEQLPIGVILADRQGTVVDLNPAAEQRLGISEAKALGRALDAVLASAADDLRAEVSPIRAGGREAGQLVLIDPPAKPG